MEGSLAAPDATLAPAGGTPLPSVEPEPVAQPTSGEPSADQSTAALAIRQREWTQATQGFAAVREALGLEGKPTRDQILENALALKARADQAEAELRELRERLPAEPPPEEDPRLAEAEARLWRAEVRLHAAIYGEDFTVDTVNLINLARTTKDPDKLIPAFAAFREKHGQGPIADDAPVASPTNGTPQPPTDIGLPDESGAPSAPPAPPAGGRRESGVVGAVREAFRAVATR